MMRLLPALHRPLGFWSSVWARMEAEGTAGVVFCDGTVTDAPAFAEEMNAPHVHPFCVLRDGLLAALLWLTNLEGRSCRGHFVVFREFWPESRALGAFALRKLLAQTYDDGSHCFDVVLGMIPRRNMRAVNVARKAGFAYIGTIPNAAWIAAERKSEDMVLLAATRKDE